MIAPLEEWRDVVGSEEFYEVSSHGRVRSKPRILKPASIPTGHLGLNLGSKRREYVHRLVAEAFTPRASSERTWVNHKNGNPKDNRVENLEWVTPGENIAHGYRNNGRRAYSEKRVAAVDSDGVLFASFRSMSDAARFLKVTKGAIASAVRLGGRCCGYRWVVL